MNNKWLLELTGQTTDHLHFCTELNCQIHKKVYGPLLKLNERLKANHYKLKVVSSFRSYEHQKKIWEEKVSGKRVILDEFELPVDPQKVDKTELLFLILNWSMIPGFSRHHLGTDLDVCDESQITNEYKIKLTNEECDEGGPFFSFHQFLDKLIEHDKAYGFLRPYTQLGGGVKPERWHISHHETAEFYQDRLTLDLFIDIISKSDLSLKEQILNHADIIFDHYIKIN